MEYARPGHPIKRTLKWFLLIFAILCVGVLVFFDWVARWGRSMGFPPNPGRTIPQMQTMVSLVRHLNAVQKSGEPMPDTQAFNDRIAALPAFREWSAFYRKGDTPHNASLYICLLGWSEINACYSFGDPDSKWNGWSFRGAYIQGKDYEHFAP